MEQRRDVFQKLDSLASRFFDYLAKRSKVVWSLVIGFLIAMFTFADDEQIAGVVRHVFEFGYAIFGLILLGVGWYNIRDSYEGKKYDTWLEKDKKPSVMDRGLGFTFGVALALWGGGTLVFAVLALLGIV